MGNTTKQFLNIEKINSQMVEQVASKAAIEEKIQNTACLVYSKSYCPFAKQTKDLLKSKRMKDGALEIVELDQIPSGAEIQGLLKEITGQRTVPNVFIGGKHIGGNSDV